MKNKIICYERRDQDINTRNELMFRLSELSSISIWKDAGDDGLLGVYMIIDGVRFDYILTIEEYEHLKKRLLN